MPDLIVNTRLPFHFLACVTFALLLFGKPALFGAELTIAAASNMKVAFDELAKKFEASHPEISTRITYGSSGNFYSQIQNDAPFDIFFSADMEYPRRLVQSGFALETNVFRYAIGRIVVWIPKSSTLNIEKDGLKALSGPGVKKIAIANPRHAPYGAAAVSAMEKAGIYELVKEHLVFGENVSQAAQFVQSGAADAGIIALSLVVAPPMRDSGRHWEIPANYHPEIEQGAIILRTTKQPEAARKFFVYMQSTNAREVMRRFGYMVPD